MNQPPRADAGSFRDPGNRVYHHPDGRVLRAVDEKTGNNLRRLVAQPFFQQWVAAGKIIATEAAAETTIDNWHSVFSHPRLPFISYPYEWTFSMLQDAALLQLQLQEQALEQGWTCKDATPYNIQWRGTKPVFIDVASLTPATAGEPWAAYRQFCMLFLYPLLLQAHIRITFNPLLRAELDGISPAAAAAHFYGWRRFKKGVLPHVIFPALVEKKIAAAERDSTPARKRSYKPQSAAAQFGLLQGLAHTVRSLQLPQQHSDWSHYAQTHSYNEEDFAAKQDFVRQVAAQQQRQLVWDLGANTGAFAEICADHADCVIAVDSDHQAVEQLYQRQRQKKANNIITLCLNLANLSPNQGFAGSERMAFDCRSRPQLVLCLALVHHLRISANIPMPLFLTWLRRLNAEAVVEFVGRDDEMTQKLLLNKKENYADYTQENFVRELSARFEIVQTVPLKNNKRTLYHLRPRD